MEPLTPDEVECVRHFMGRIGCADATIAAGPLALIESWRTLVVACEKGCVVERFEFLQDLSVRTLLARLIGRLPRPLALKLEGSLHVLDFRWRAIPKSNDEFLLDARLAHRHPPERDSWLYGWPATVRLR